MPYELSRDNVRALMPLQKPWEEPTRHRLPNPKGEGPALIQPGRRPSPCPLVPALRTLVGAWRQSGYPGASETTRYLLQYWFDSDHRVPDEDGHLIPFHYHWAQREAIETIIYLYEVRGIRNVEELLYECGDAKLQQLAAGINPQDDRWLRACCKMATGTGKTKVMSLAIAWSYFHRLREPDSTLPLHFVLIAPNLTVYERLKDDFENGAIFYRDPVLPPEWKHDFQVQVVLQDEPGGATTPGAVYVTNIHRLYEARDSNAAPADETEAIFGPSVKRAQALDTGAALRERLARHPCLMIINDEAHHVHDPDLAWTRAIETLHAQSQRLGNAGVGLQLDFTATPKHPDGSLFRHIVSDYPLGDAVDAGIVKVPVLGESDELRLLGDKGAPASQRYRIHLQIAYQRYVSQFEEYGKVRKPILFVMTEDAKSADDIAAYLDSEAFPLLRGRVLNIHTRLKGSLKKVQRGGREIREFVENEKGISAEDLRELRRISRELDAKDSPYRCVVSVLMLREGWDVRNVTTIVPLRPLTAQAEILPEQTLGRGLRRMFPEQELPEKVVVIDHPKFRKLYAQELALEGVDVAIERLTEEEKQTVSIYVDWEHKPVTELEIAWPQVTEAYVSRPELEELTFEEIRDYFRKNFKPLPVREESAQELVYQERHILTDEIVAQWKIPLGLLEKAYLAADYFAQMLGRLCHLPSPTRKLKPLLERFLAEVLFERPVDLYSGEVDHRMKDRDVLAYVQATFEPLLRRKLICQQERERLPQQHRLSEWRPYQATATPDRPAVDASRTMFNLVPCDNGFEQEFVEFCDYAPDVAAFARNAGPQKLMIDYLRPTGQSALYAPDFFVRLTDGRYLLVELKGRADDDVAVKARAAVEWCKAASSAEVFWDYLYVPYETFQDIGFSPMEELLGACQPALQKLLAEAEIQQDAIRAQEAILRARTEAFYQELLRDAGLSELPAPIETPAREAAQLLEYVIAQNMSNLASPFHQLLYLFDVYAMQIVERVLGPRIPSDEALHQSYFNPPLDSLHYSLRKQMERNQRFLRQNLVHGRSLQRMGTLLFCIYYAHKERADIGGVWRDVAEVFAAPEFAEVYDDLSAVNRLRNKSVAHVEEPLSDPAAARAALSQWLRCLEKLYRLAMFRWPHTAAS